MATATTNKNGVFVFPRDEDITASIVGDFIKLHKAKLTRYLRLKSLYESNAPIVSRAAKATYKPDNRLVVNYAKYITDTFNGYFAGIPVKVNHEDEAVIEKVSLFIRENDMDDNLAELSKLTSIYGHAYEMLYQDEETITRCIYNDPMDMFIVYDDTIQQLPLFAVRYQYNTDNELTGQMFTAVAEYTLTDKGLQDEKAHFYGNVPIIEYIENEERQSVFENVESLINAFDKSISEKANDVDYFADAYMKLIGMELDEDGLATIRDSRIINLFGAEDASKIIVEFMEKPNGDDNQEHLLDRLERLIYQISMVANINDESFGNASGVALEFKLQPMSNKAAMKERKFASGMNKRFKMWFNLPTNMEAGKKDEWRNLEYKFTRNIPHNIADEASVASSLAGITSKETQLSTLSIVGNVKDEIAKIEEETGNSGYSVDANGDFLTSGG